MWKQVCLVLFSLAVGWAGCPYLLGRLDLAHPLPPGHDFDPSSLLETQTETQTEELPPASGIRKITGKQNLYALLSDEGEIPSPDEKPVSWSRVVAKAAEKAEKAKKSNKESVENSWFNKAHASKSAMKSLSSLVPEPSASHEKVSIGANRVKMPVKILSSTTNHQNSHHVNPNLPQQPQAPTGLKLTGITNIGRRGNLRVENGVVTGLNRCPAEPCLGVREANLQYRLRDITPWDFVDELNRDYHGLESPDPYRLHGHVSLEYGFLPGPKHPIDWNFPPNTPFKVWDDIVSQLPSVCKQSGIRDIVRSETERLKKAYESINQLKPRYYRRASTVLGTIAHAYFRCFDARDEPEDVVHLPKPLKEAWRYVSKKRERPEMMDMGYLDILLDNWKPKTPLSPHVTGQVQMMNPIFESREEEVHVGVFVELESAVPPLLADMMAVLKLINGVSSGKTKKAKRQRATIIRSLMRIRHGLKDVVGIFRKFSQIPDSDTFADSATWGRTFATFTNPLHNSEFKGSGRVAGGLQAVFIQALDIFLGRDEYCSHLGQLALVEREWMPKNHAQLLYSMEILPVDLKGYVTRALIQESDVELAGLFNGIIDGFAGKKSFLHAHQIKAWGYLEQTVQFGRVITTGMTEGGEDAGNTCQWDPLDTNYQVLIDAREERIKMKIRHNNKQWKLPETIFAKFKKTQRASHLHDTKYALKASRDGEAATLGNYLDMKRRTLRGNGSGPNLHNIAHTQRMIKLPVNQVTLDVTGTGLVWAPGDRLRVFPRNPKKLVERTLEALSQAFNMTVKAASEMEVKTASSKWSRILDNRSILGPWIPTRYVKLKDLVAYGQIRPMSILTVAEMVKCVDSNQVAAMFSSRLQSVVLGNANEFLSKYELWDVVKALVLEEQNHNTPVLNRRCFKDSIGDIIPPLQPRQYSISSRMDQFAEYEDANGALFPTELSLTVTPFQIFGERLSASVELYEAPPLKAVPDIVEKVKQDGVGSTFLIENGNEEDMVVPVDIIMQDSFRLPEKLDNGQYPPIFMVATMGGIAPFIGFLEELAATGSRGNIMYVTVAYEEDIPYRERLGEYLKSGILLRLVVAVTRERKYCATAGEFTKYGAMKHTIQNALKAAGFDGSYGKTTLVCMQYNVPFEHTSGHPLVKAEIRWRKPHTDPRKSKHEYEYDIRYETGETATVSFEDIVVPRCGDEYVGLRTQLGVYAHAKCDKRYIMHRVLAQCPGNQTEWYWATAHVHDQQTAETIKVVFGSTGPCSGQEVQLHRWEMVSAIGGERDPLVGVLPVGLDVYAVKYQKKIQFKKYFSSENPVQITCQPPQCFTKLPDRLSTKEKADLFRALVEKSMGGKSAHLYMCGPGFLNTFTHRIVQGVIRGVLQGSGKGVGKHRVWRFHRKSARLIKEWGIDPNDADAFARNYLYRMHAQGRMHSDTFTSEVSQKVKRGMSYSDMAQEALDTGKTLFSVLDTVYDATNYVYFHPGGEKTITEKAGTDATPQFIRVHHDDDPSEVLGIMSAYTVGMILNPEVRWDGELCLACGEAISAAQGLMDKMLIRRNMFFNDLLTDAKYRARVVGKEAYDRYPALMDDVCTETPEIAKVVFRRFKSSYLPDMMNWFVLSCGRLKDLYSPLDASFASDLQCSFDVEGECAIDLEAQPCGDTAKKVADKLLATAIAAVGVTRATEQTDRKNNLILKQIGRSVEILRRHLTDLCRGKLDVDPSADVESMRELPFDPTT